MSGILTASSGIIAYGSSSGGDANLAFNNANAGFWFRNASSITLNLNSAGTITSDGGIGGGPTAWYTGSPTGSNFETQVTWTLSPGPGASTVLVGPSGSQSAITLGNTSAFYNLGSNILLTVEQLTGIEDVPAFTVVIRQVSLPSNSISKTFELDWFT